MEDISSEKWETKTIFEKQQIKKSSPKKQQMKSDAEK